MKANWISKTFVAMMVLALPVLAHHSFSAEFDRNKPVKLEGTVLKMEWVNPHSWLHIQVAKPDGTKEEWAVEGGSPGVLFRNGWTKESLKAGTRIVVNGSQAKDGSLRANAANITFPDGRTLDAGSSGGNPATK
jgi:Family of unknown function (DUF6152)